MAACDAPVMANSPMCRNLSRTSAELLNVLVGMQPELRHVPPMASLSTSVTA